MSAQDGYLERDQLLDSLIQWVGAELCIFNWALLDAESVPS